MRFRNFVKTVFTWSLVIGTGGLLFSMVVLLLHNTRHSQIQNLMTSPPNDNSRNDRSEQHNTPLWFGVKSNSTTKSKYEKRNNNYPNEIYTSRDRHKPHLAIKAKVSFWSTDSTHKLCLFNNFGKLGNQIYEYASVLGIARNKDLLPLIDKAVYRILEKTFNLTIPAKFIKNSSTQCNKNNFISLRGGQSALLSRPIIDAIKLPVKYDYKLQGFHQSWMYFYDHQDEIKQEFTFKDDLREEATSLIKLMSKKLLSKFAPDDRVTYVGVHLRRNLDFKGYKEYGLIMPPKEYYRRAMNYFMERYKNVIFIVCSNGIKYAKDHLSSYPAIFIKPLSERPELDLCLLSLCNHSIISAGTYSFWSAFLSNGETIYFKTPFAIGSRYSQKYSEHLSDYYPPYWTPMA